VALGVSFVELVSDDGTSPRDDEETLASRRMRPLPAWVGRLVAAPLRFRYAALVAVLVGGLLAADQAVAPISTPMPIAQTAGLVYADRGHCPITVSCQVEGRPRQDMWASYNALFVNTSPFGGSVWYDPKSGIVYFQELDAVGASGQTITLIEQRLDSKPDVSFAPTVDITPRSRAAGPGPTRRNALVTARRGPWLVSASLAGSASVRLPVDAALHWAAVAPLPG